MPRKPNSKAKNREEIDAQEAEEIILIISAEQQVPSDVLARILQLNQAPCPPSCGLKGHKGNKDNPRCVCALVPAAGSYRKKGLWQKEPPLGELGHDPSEQRRLVSCRL